MKKKSNSAKALSSSMGLRFLPLSLSLLLFLLPILLFPAILTVKQDGTGDFTIIQEAYLAASSGDTVLVWPGTYYENLYITDHNKDITIASLHLTTLDKSYIQNTIIDGNQNGSCVVVKNTDQAEVVINGFTVQNGNSYNTEQKNGGGIYINTASPSIKNCIIQNNIAIHGGGIHCSYSNTYFSGITVRNNHAYLSGGGVKCSYDANTIFDPLYKCNIYLNYSPYGSDYKKNNYSPSQEIILDTFTVQQTNQHFIYSNDVYGYPLDDLTIEIENGKIEPVNNNLYVNPETGDDANNGLTPGAALKTIAYALHIIASDSLDPKSIYLSNGTYSPSTNGELFPLNGRSYVSLIGESRDSTIFDADSLYYFFRSYGLMKNIQIESISFKNGYGFLNTSYLSGLIIQISNNVELCNLLLSNCTGIGVSGLYFSKSGNIKTNKTHLDNNKGAPNFFAANSFDPPKKFSINKCLITGAGPAHDINYEGSGMNIGGSLPEPGMISGKITNLQITDNLRIPDPLWGPGMAGGLIVSNHAKVDLVNATIGKNVLRGEQGFTVNVNEGSELNIYNSILFGDSLNELSLGYPSGSDFPATASIAYSNIEGGEDEIMNWYNQHTLNWLDGNIDEDPRWAGTGDTTYYLLNDSPCINAGTPMYEEGMDYPYIKIENEKIVLYKYDGDTIHLPSTDLAGNPRISGGRIDMGAYEYQDTTSAIGGPAKTEYDTKVLAYPNPFTAHTFISFRLFNPCKVVVKISDINGRHVRTLMDAKTSRGEFTMTWEGTDDYGNVVRTGTYIINFFVNNRKITDKKIVKR